MRIRSIKPEFWPHRMHKRISEPAALLALALLNFADDDGRFEADPNVIEALLFVYRRLSKPTLDCLHELEHVGFIHLYDGTVDGEQTRLGQIVNFSRHQVINKHRPSQLPPPPKNHRAEPVPEPLPDASGSPTVVVSDESGSATSFENSSETVALLRSMEGRKEGKEGAPRACACAREPGSAEVPTLEEVIDFCQGAVAIPPEYGRKYFDDKQASPSMWFDGRGNLRDWRYQLRAWWNRDRHRWTPDKNPAGADVRSLEAELQCETDPEKRRELRRRIKEGR